MTVANYVDSDPRRPSPSLGDRYRAGAGLGHGASARTFAAEDVTTGDRVVVKLFESTSTATATSEFQQLLGLAHPNVVRVRDIGRAADGRPFVVTELVPGAALDSLAVIVDVAERRRVFEQAAEALADALAHLHARGVMHGDVCPANVRLDAAGRAVLIDFGLAGPAEPGAGGARGTLGYAAPEALTGARTAAGDLFGLGATLFAAWTGVAPFGVGLPAVQRMLTGRAPSLSSIRAGLPEAWDRILDRLLAPDPRERPASARELLREVRRARGGNETPTEVDLAVPHPAGDPLEGVVVGRAAERETLRAALERVAEGASASAVMAVVGAPGSGRGTLIDAAARELAVAVTAGAARDVELWRGELDALETFAGVTRPASPLDESDGDAGRALQRRLAALCEALERRAAARPLCVILPEGPTTDALAAVMGGAAPSGRLLLVAPTAAPLERAFVNNVILAPLSPAEVGELVTRALGGDIAPPEAIAALVAAGRGHAALVAVLARRLIAALRARRPGSRRPRGSRPGRSRRASTRRARRGWARWGATPRRSPRSSRRGRRRAMTRSGCSSSSGARGCSRARATSRRPPSSSRPRSATAPRSPRNE